MPREPDPIKLKLPELYQAWLEWALANNADNSWRAKAITDRIIEKIKDSTLPLEGPEFYSDDQGGPLGNPLIAQLVAERRAKDRTPSSEIPLVPSPSHGNTQTEEINNITPDNYRDENPWPERKNSKKKIIILLFLLLLLVGGGVFEFFSFQSQQSSNPLPTPSPSDIIVPPSIAIPTPKPSPSPVRPSPTPPPSTVPSPPTTPLTVQGDRQACVVRGQNETITIHTRAGGNVSIKVQYPNKSVIISGAGTADPSGTFVNTFTVPSNMTVGQAQFSVTATSQGQTAFANGAFNIYADRNSFGSFC
jgi:hypothetical protein